MTREMDKETITKTLLGFWKEVLGQEVSAEDEFFNIGGSSLTMFQLLGKISEVFSLEIIVVQLSRHKFNLFIMNRYM